MKKCHVHVMCMSMIEMGHLQPHTHMMKALVGKEGKGEKTERDRARVEKNEWEYCLYPGPWVLGFEVYGCFFSFFLLF